MAGQRSSRAAASRCYVLALQLLLAAGPLASAGDEEQRGAGPAAQVLRGPRLLAPRPCEEIYVVGEGETLHSISARCGDPYILERNPHVHDSDDVFPGLVIRITPARSGSRRDGGPN